MSMQISMVVKITNSDWMKQYNPMFNPDIAQKSSQYKEKKWGGKAQNCLKTLFK